MCNYCQAYFIDCDAEMYHEQSNMPAVARTSNMNSDLGMVECIFRFEDYCMYVCVGMHDVSVRSGPFLSVSATRRAR